MNLMPYAYTLLLRHSICRSTLEVNFSIILRKQGVLIPLSDGSTNLPASYITFNWPNIFLISILCLTILFVYDVAGVVSVSSKYVL
jgi:hypothetical protein